MIYFAIFSIVVILKSTHFTVMEFRTESCYLLPILNACIDKFIFHRTVMLLRYVANWQYVNSGYAICLDHAS